MTFDKFIKRDNLIDILFEKLDLISYCQRTIHVNNHPDYDVSGYHGLSIVPYYFHHSWKFGNLYYSVIKAGFGRYGIFNYSSINDLLEEVGQPSIRHDEPLESAVERAAKFAHENSYIYHDHEYENFTVKKIEVNYINNYSKEIEYSGFFNGDSTAIEDDIILIAELNMKVINANLSDPLYRLLLADSYMHLHNQQYNQAFFYAFVAFETYINQFKPKGQLKQKLQDMQKQESICFSTAVKELKRFEDIRNAIAHGKELVRISKDILTELYAVVAPFILYREANIITYNQILKKNGKLPRLGI